MKKAFLAKAGRERRFREIPAGGQGRILRGGARQHKLPEQTPVDRRRLSLDIPCMFSLRKPTRDDARKFCASQASAPFTYAAVGATADVPPPGFDVDRLRVPIGAGPEAFERAKQALLAWRQFDLGWVEAVLADAPLIAGQVVAVAGRACGAWTLNAARIVYVVDEPQRFGFAYGTLPRHVECGEERFLVEYDAEGRVWYEVAAFSRPRHLAARLAYPFLRRWQARFRRESAEVLRRVVAAAHSAGESNGCERRSVAPTFRFASIALFVLAMVGAAAAFVLPRTGARPIGGEALRRYAPLEDGDGRRATVHDSAGRATSVQSTNVRLLHPAAALASELRTAQRAALARLLLRPGETQLDDGETSERLAAEGELFEVRTREVDASGKFAESAAFLVRTATGLFLVGSRSDGSDDDLSYHPPLKLLDAHCDVGRSWSQTGEQRLGESTVAYRWEARIEAAEFDADEPRRDGDFRAVRNRLQLLRRDRTIYDVTIVERYAADRGIVAWTKFDDDGKLLERGVAGLDTDELPASSASSAAEPTPAAFDSWSLTPFAAAMPAGPNVVGNVAPSWIPTDPPLIVVVDADGDLTARSAADGTAPIAWRFHPRGTIVSPPTFDPRRNRLYFGTTAKRVYCLDAHGLFRWSYDAGDAVVAQPRAAGDFVFFGCEDRHVYILDATTGSLRRRHRCGGPIASSFAVARDTAAVGSDDGCAYAFDPATGDLHWTESCDGPIETPLEAAGSMLLATTYEGAVVALDSATGRRLWAVDGGERFESGCVARDELAFAVDGGCLSVIETATGRRRLRTADLGYVGPPAIVGEALFVARRDGAIQRLDREGKPSQTWTCAASSFGGATPEFRRGPIVGGGALWIVDARSNLWRLGPRTHEPTPLRLRWTKRFTDAPFAKSYLNVTPVRYGRKAVVLDAERNIYLADPAAGEVRTVGKFGGAGTVSVEPVVAGDTLIASAADTLYAVRLSDGLPLWTFAGQGVPFHPAAVAGDLVFWMVQHSEPPADGSSGTLYALRAETGALAWKKPLGAHVAPGGIAVDGRRLYLSAPSAAYDCATGRELWRMQGSEAALGGGTLDFSQETFFVGLVDAQGQGLLRALRTDDGRTLRDVRLGRDVLHPFERPWISGTTLIVPLWSGEIVAFAEDGAELWRHRPTPPRLGGITVADEKVWLMRRNSEVAALDAATGRIVARHAINVNLTAVDGFAPRPLVADGYVAAPLTLNLFTFELLR